MTLTLGHLLGEWQVEPTRCVVMRHLRAAFAGWGRAWPHLRDADHPVHGTAHLIALWPN